MAATGNLLENVGWAQAFHSISMSQLKAKKVRLWINSNVPSTEYFLLILS